MSVTKRHKVLYGSINDCVTGLSQPRYVSTNLVAQSKGEKNPDKLLSNARYSYEYITTALHKQNERGRQTAHQVTAGVLETSPLIAIYYDRTIVSCRAKLATCVCVSATREINPAVLCLLYARREIDKREGQREESLTHLLLGDRQLPYVCTCAAWECWGEN